MIASSVIRGCWRKRTLPAAACSAKSSRYAAFCPLNPAPRNASTGKDKTARAVNVRTPAVSCRRPKIVAAAFPDNCWYTIDRASEWKLGEWILRRHSGAC